MITRPIPPPSWLRLSKIHFSSHVTIQYRNDSLLLHRKKDNILDVFLIFGRLMRHPLIELFHISNLLHLLNDHRMVYVEFFGNFSCSCKRINFHDCSQLVIINSWRLATVLLIFKSLISFAKVLEPPLHCMFISSSWAKCVDDVARSLHCSTTHLNSNKKITQIANFCLTSYP